jgi:hypothetical protein
MGRGFGFVAVTIDVRDQLLLPVDGAAISPTSQQVIAGTRLRGVLAQRAAGVDRALIGALIASGDVAAGTAFPVTAEGLEGYPAPVTAVSSDTALDAEGPDPQGRMWVLDERGELPKHARLQRLSGLVVRKVHEWIPVHVDTVTAQRLTRRRAGGDQSGLGPMTFTTVAAQQRFRAWFRIAGNPDGRAELAALLAQLLDGQVVALGSGEQNAYGGDPLFQVGSLVDGPPGLPAAALLGQAAEVDIVLRTPALVTDPGTGHYRPDTLADHVEQLLLGAGMSGRVISASVRQTAVSGATVGYGRMRPQQWAAAAGSVVRVRLDAPVADWSRVATCRVGHRTVDGFGVLGVEVPDAPGRALLRPPQRPSIIAPAGSVVLAAGPPEPLAAPEGVTGVASAQRDLLQHRLFEQASDVWRPSAVTAVVAGLTGWEDVPASAWGRLRDAAAAIDTWRELMRALQETTDCPLKKQLSDTTIRPLEPPARQFTPKPLLDWLAAAADANTETLWAPLGEQLRGWAEELKLVCLEQQPPTAGRPPDSVLHWIQAHQIDEGRAIARAVLHTVQQAAAS